MKLSYDIKEDLQLAIRDFKNFITKIEDLDNITFIIHLKNGSSIKASKVERWRTYWQLEYNNQTYNTKYDSSIINNIICKNHLSSIEYFKKHIHSFDSDYKYSQDNRVFTSGNEHEKYIRNLFTELSIEDKNEAIKFSNHKIKLV